MVSLFERYRPRTYDDVVGQPKAVALLKRISVAGHAFWLAAPSGTGKTTLARLMASSIAESWAIEEIDAQDCNLDFVRDMERSFAFRAMGAKTGKAWIINEAHGLRGHVLSRFLTLIEAMPSHCAIIFTTTNAGQKSLFEDFDDATPLLSRCVVVPLAWHEYAADTVGPLTKAFAQRALTIARTEKLDGQPLSAYERLALECKHNLRQMLSKIEAGEMLV